MPASVKASALTKFVTMRSFPPWDVVHCDDVGPGSGDIAIHEAVVDRNFDNPIHRARVLGVF